MNTKKKTINFNFAKLDNVKVKNMIGNSGREIPNQFLITTNKGIYFQSYKSIIAFVPFGDGKTILGTDWAYSNTTSKYRNDFLGEEKAETQSKIKEGVYLVNPNW